MTKVSDRLSRVRWGSERRYRSLSYLFSIRWNRATVGSYVETVLDPFIDLREPEQVQAGLSSPPRYSLADLGAKAEPRYVLLANDEVLIDCTRRDDAVHHLFWHILTETFRRTGDFLVVHAGAVATPSGEGVLLPGEATSGKTTLTAALVQAGFFYLSDEAGAIDPVTRRLYPYPRTLNLRLDTLDMFGDLATGNGSPTVVQGRWYLRPDAIRPQAVSGPCPVRFVVAPSFRQGAATELESMTPGQTLQELWANLWNLAPYGHRALHLLADVVREARGWRLTFGDLGEGLAAIRSVTEA